MLGSFEDLAPTLSCYLGCQGEMGTPEQSETSTKDHSLGQSLHPRHV